MPRRSWSHSDRCTRPCCGRRFDIPGAVTVTAAMLLVVDTVVGAPQVGWASPRTLGSFAGVAVLLAAFVAIERRSTDPLLRLGIFRSGALTRANLTAMTLFGSYVAFQFLVTQWWTPAGVTMSPLARAWLPTGPRSPSSPAWRWQACWWR